MLINPSKASDRVCLVATRDHPSFENMDSSFKSLIIEPRTIISDADGNVVKLACIVLVK